MQSNYDKNTIRKANPVASSNHIACLCIVKQNWKVTAMQQLIQPTSIDHVKQDACERATMVILYIIFSRGICQR